MSDPDENGVRSLTFEVNGAMRGVKIQDKHLEVNADRKPKAEKGNQFHVGSPIPGTVSKINVKEGDVIEKNTALLTVEAMKMETSILAKIGGKIDKIYVKQGDKVMPEDLLVTFVNE